MELKPTKAQILWLAEKYNTVPLSTTLPATVTPTQVLQKLKTVSRHCYMLESCEDKESSGRYTFLGFDPQAEIHCKDGKGTVMDENGSRTFTGSPKPHIAALLERHKSPRLRELPTFTGGLVGYFAYDYAKYSEPQIPVRPTLEEEGSFSMILIPDPQSQIKFAANQPLFELMTAWVAQNIDRLRIRAALFTGDMVEQNDQLTGGDPVHFHNGDQTSRQQWSAVSRALERLDGRIPYIVCQGNHDVGYVAAENRLSMMPQYIYPERNTEIVAHLAAAGLNHENVHTLENAAYEFHDAAWGDLLVIAFEFAPRDEALDWARGLIESEKYRNHRVIVLTHSFLDTDGSRKKGEGYKLTPRNWPQAVWEKLVYPSKNICLVLCGHTGTPPKIDMEGGADGVAGIDYRTTSAYRVDRAADGRRIPQMMFNSQAGDGGWFGNGGDCWLRILEFRPDGRTIGVRTFSPLFALSRITARNAWRTADYDRFDIRIDDLKK